MRSALGCSPALRCAEATAGALYGATAGLRVGAAASRAGGARVDVRAESRGTRVTAAGAGTARNLLLAALLPRAAGASRM